MIDGIAHTITLGVALFIPGGDALGIGDCPVQ